MNWRRRIIRFVASGKGERVAFLINLNDSLGRIARLLKESAGDNLIVCFNAAIPEEFERARLKAKSSEDYLIKEDYEAIDSFVFEGIGKSWYLYRNITDYRDMSLGKLYEYDFQKYLIPRIKNLEIIQKVIAKENIQKIIAIEDTGELADTAEAYANFAGIPILKISFNLKRKLPSAFGCFFKNKFSFCLSSALDRLAIRRVMKIRDSGSLILIDAKLLKFFSQMDDAIIFIPVPLEKGFSLRLRLLKQGLPYLPLYVTKRRTHLKDGVQLERKWKELLSEREFKSIFNYKGIPIWGLVCDQISKFFLEIAPRAIDNINMFFEIFNTKKIKAVIIRNDVKEFERVIVFSARLAKVTSFVLQHGILAESNGHNNLIADKYIAWGRASVEWYTGFGNCPGKFEITGNPHFDILVNWKPKLSRRQLCERLNLDKDKGIILFATQQINKFSSFWTDDLFLVMADKLLKAIQQFPDKQLIIKVDPYEEISSYRSRIKRASGNNAVAIRDIDIYTLISLSELVITLDSTVALEAMIFDKPVIIFNITKRQDRVPYAEKRAAIGVYKEENLPLAIEKALTDQGTIERLKLGRKSFIEEYAYKVDGKAREKVVNLMLKMMSQHS
jgi:hypothetical protein